jgi:hypothetical protein
MLPVGLERAPVSAAGCSCRRLQRHHFDLLSFISRLLGAAHLGFPVEIRLNDRIADNPPGFDKIFSCEGQSLDQMSIDDRHR